MKSESSKTGIRRRNWLALCLCAFASIAMIGDLLGSHTIKGIGAISAAAPFPKVFCEFEGMEGFAAEFSLSCDCQGRRIEIPITPEVYARLAGPYNRRNVYGAALAGGPKLPREIWEPIFLHGLKPGGPLRKEFGLPPDATSIQIIVRTKTHGRNDVWTLEPKWTE